MIKDPSRHSDLTPQEGRTVKISEASRILQVHKDTLRRWEKNGKITPVRTPGGTRLYSLDELRSLIPRVSDDTPQSPSTEQSFAKNLSTTEADTDLKPRSIVPEFLGIVVIFLLLFAIGITNIKATPFKNSSTSQVLSVKSLDPSPTPLPTPTVSESELSQAPANADKPRIIVKINDGADSVNIRQKPTTNSEKIGKASDGDIFEFVAIDSGWYEITLPDGATGFISEKYAVMEESEN